MAKKVLVSGCFDLLHSGHIAFFQEASRFGDVHVALGSDQTIHELKGRVPVTNERERLFMVGSIATVKRAFISRGSGMLDFEAEMRELRPDYLVVNEEGNTPEKERLCRDLGVEYVVLRRQPEAGMAARSTTALRKMDEMPYRIDLCGGWLDQPFVSRHHPGAVVTLSLEPTIEFNERSGMASSTRRAAIDLWGPRLPAGDPERLAKMLFAWDNPPGTEEVSGSQDAIGIVCAGLARSMYRGRYWPDVIDRNLDEGALRFVEDALNFVPLGPRHSDFRVLEGTRIDAAGARRLAEATDRCWEAIRARDLGAFGSAIRDGFGAQIAMFPNMVNDTIQELIARYRDDAVGWKVSGAGGGGYLVVVSAKPIPRAVRVKARRAV
ncbi:MAG TPA: adenylyltransferase/cytidyltransferase family protein [Verrucomicrobiae bacterium]|nr:adenylyltransferase/cytidyltransferase family protein [Verrucomicrobiae bacterium]